MFCQTCCMHINGTCFNSRVISEILIKANQNFTLRTEISFTDSIIQKAETICNKLTCFHLNFHHFPENSYCTYQGKVGICIKSRCILPPFIPSRLPFIRQSTITGCGNSLEYLQTWIILILINMTII